MCIGLLVIFDICRFYSSRKITRQNSSILMKMLRLYESHRAEINPSTLDTPQKIQRDVATSSSLPTKEFDVAKVSSM